MIKSGIGYPHKLKACGRDQNRQKLKKSLPLKDKLPGVRVQELEATSAGGGGKGQYSGLTKHPEGWGGKSGTQRWDALTSTYKICPNLEH